MGTRLLVVDGDAATTELVRAATSPSDCEIIAVATSQAAVEHIRGSSHIDLAIIDQALEAPAVMTALAASRPFCPCVIVTAELSFDGAREALHGGAVDYLHKRESPEALGRAIATGLARHRQVLRLRESQRLETVGEIVGGIAHDFNNLLVVITNFAELIGEMCHGREDSSIAEMAESIAQAGKSAATLTRQMLELARHKDPVPEPVDLHELLDGIEKLLRGAMGAHHKLAIGPVPVDCSVVADRGQLEHVLLNLAVHARDVMPSGSTFSIDVTRAGDEVCIIARAAGTQISEIALAHLFDPFFVTRESVAGSGFGLAAARDLIDGMGGSLAASADADGGTDVDEGTTFRVELPAAAV